MKIRVDCLTEKDNYPRSNSVFYFDIDPSYWINLGMLYRNLQGNENYWYRKAR